MKRPRKRTLLAILLALLLLTGLLAGRWMPEDAAGGLFAEEPPQPLTVAVAEGAALEEAEEAPTGFSTGRVSFAVQVKDEVIPYEVFGLFVIPGETVEIEAVFTEGRRSATFAAEAGTVAPRGPETWQWTAPATPGLYPLRVTDEAAGETITLNTFVMVPFDHGQQALNGYRIGRYEPAPLRGDPAYLRPPGFVEVTPETRDVPVAPHFTLGQFLCKQESDYPKYLLVRERLLLKLEMILEAVNDLGVEAQTLHVMSAFRTPHYNRAIGNTTTYSRHLYGGAADIFVDTDDDGVMDDLDGDGAITEADARVLAAIIEGETDEAWYRPFLGGLGIYAPAPHRGPFIHVDVRGQRARW